MKIFLNPGHDRDVDSGAVNPVSGMRECDVVHNVGVAITNCVKDILENHGIEVVSAQNDSLAWVTEYANESGADYFVSIHCNAFNTQAHGTEVETYSFGTYGAKLAQSIQDEIVKEMGTTDRGIKERPGLYVLKYTDMPAVLIELAFIDNQNDAVLLANEQERFASAVARGILNFLGYDVENDDNYNDTNMISPAGIPYEDNDIQYLLNQGYTLTAAKSFLDTIDKYSRSNMQKAAEYADSRVGSTGYGNNGCTAWVKDFLIHADHWFGQLMADGSQGNLMWVPNIMEYAKANGLWKEPEEGGALGDICLLETNYCREDGPDHVVIACGDGNYWGNSSSRNKIVKSSIAYDYGSENVWGYVKTGSGVGAVSSGASGRSAAEIVGDAGSTSYVNLAPNGKVYEENDIQYLLKQGYTVEEAIVELSKADKYTKITYTAPNGKPYDDNDIQYLLNQGYTLDAALNFLSTADKYLKR